MSQFSTIAAANPFANPIYGLKATKARQFSAASVVENSPLRVFSAAAGSGTAVPELAGRLSDCPPLRTV
jgi:hypothetical protein